MFEDAALLEGFFQERPSLQAHFPRSDAGELDWRPAVDAQQRSEKVVFIVALPGVDIKDVRITIDSECLVISGRRFKRAGEGWVRQELVAGPFARRLPLPANARADGLVTAYKDGMLEVNLPRQ